MQVANSDLPTNCRHHGNASRVDCTQFSRTSRMEGSLRLIVELY